jgi:riboflavin kinase/FMN adenylyltransferase
MEFAKLTSFEFIKKILVEKVGVKKMVVGYDHHFGRDRLGNYSSLQDIGRNFGFEVEEISAQYVDGVPVSSSKIRRALNDGDIQTANKLLGYEYSIYGKVVEGYKIGKTIGFPTANIEVDDELKLITANGVYACKIIWKDQKYLGMGNIGVRPTLNRKDLTIEVHIFDFDEDIYGDCLTVYWIDRIRDEIKFENLDALKQQLISDKQTTLRILGKK